jgi:hypothetical protein
VQGNSDILTDLVPCALHVTAIGRSVVVVRAFVMKTPKTPRAHLAGAEVAEPGVTIVGGGA